MKSWQRLSYAALKFKLLPYCEELRRKTALQRSEHRLKTQERSKKQTMVFKSGKKTNHFLE